DIIWAAEHHAIETTIGPAPFQLLAHFANHTFRIRLGTGVVVAPYWHPVKLAGEAALLDWISNGRLEFGIGRGAYQREFDRMADGIDQKIGGPMMQEMLPALKKLWAGDYTHEGKYWSFPNSTSVPKPLQKPHPPIWVAARDPETFKMAVKEGYSIMSWPLTRPLAELDTYLARFKAALAAAGPLPVRPRFMAMRHVGVWENARERDVFIESIRRQGRQFENLFKNLAPVIDGFPQEPDISLLENQAEYEPEVLMQNLILGTPDEVIAKLKPYEERGVDYFCYNAAYGLPIEKQQSSLRLFIDEVMPAFQETQKRVPAPVGAK
ncbi:MAG: LLM class flavin-dependent oxidoreductase, partial [Pseudorhodoplanes sp.]